MERVDPEGLWTLVEGHTHKKFNGAHCVSRTQGFVIGPHDDSGTPGALERVFFWKPTPEAVAAAGTRVDVTTGVLKPGQEY